MSYLLVFTQIERLDRGERSSWFEGSSTWRHQEWNHSRVQQPRWSRQTSGDRTQHPVHVLERCWRRPRLVTRTNMWRHYSDHHDVTTFFSYLSVSSIYDVRKRRAVRKRRTPSSTCARSADPRLRSSVSLSTLSDPSSWLSVATTPTSDFTTGAL